MCVCLCSVYVEFATWSIENWDTESLPCWTRHQPPSSTERQRPQWPLPIITDVRVNQSVDNHNPIPRAEQQRTAEGGPHRKRHQYKRRGTVNPHPSGSRIPQASAIQMRDPTSPRARTPSLRIPHQSDQSLSPQRPLPRESGRTCPTAHKTQYAARTIWGGGNTRKPFSSSLTITPVHQTLTWVINAQPIQRGGEKQLSLKLRTANIWFKCGPKAQSFTSAQWTGALCSSEYIRRNSNCFLIVFILLWWMIA